MRNKALLREKYIELSLSLDCGDNSCLFAKGGGVRTNGGCSCFDTIDSRKARRIRNMILAVKRFLEEPNQ